MIYGIGLMEISVTWKRTILNVGLIYMGLNGVSYTWIV